MKGCLFHTLPAHFDLFRLGEWSGNALPVKARWLFLETLCSPSRKIFLELVHFGEYFPSPLLFLSRSSSVHSPLRFDGSSCFGVSSQRSHGVSSSPPSAYESRSVAPAPISLRNQARGRRTCRERNGECGHGWRSSWTRRWASSPVWEWLEMRGGRVGNRAGAQQVTASAQSNARAAPHFAVFGGYVFISETQWIRPTLCNIFQRVRPQCSFPALLSVSLSHPTWISSSSEVFSWGFALHLQIL